MIRRLPLTILALALAALAPTSAHAASTTLTIRGAGFGHGVGMSQYGALGFAQHGADYRAILAHYYSGTALGALTEDPEVRVLLADGRGKVAFTGVARVGAQILDPARTYTAVPGGDGVLIRDGARAVVTGTAPMRLQPPTAGAFTVLGARYRGALELRPSGRGLMAVDAVGLEDYVRGVVGRESPASWPIEALRAQAVAARTYALATAHPGAPFDQYQDTRSQVYGGVAAETPSTEQAVSSTAGQVVTYQGRPVVTYFFSTSGGRTENVENAFLGSAPKPWLTSVDDPYDDLSPRHRWGPLRLTDQQAAARLGRLVKGRFLRIDVQRRGVSPRIVSATVVGTRGKVKVDGPTLRRAFGLDDTWAYFTSVTSGVKVPPADAPATPALPSVAGGSTFDGARAAAVRSRALDVVTGRISPARPHAWVRLERLGRGVWTTAADARLSGAGTYAITAPGAGTYRVRLGRQVIGPSVRVA